MEELWQDAMLGLIAIMAAVGAVQCLVLLTLILALGRVQRHSRALQAAATTLHSAAAKLEAVAAREVGAPRERPRSDHIDPGSIAPARKRVNSLFGRPPRRAEGQGEGVGPAGEPGASTLAEPARPH